MRTGRSFFSSIGSLWFAGVLLVLLLVAMACATVVESEHGADRALSGFYHAWWFRTLLALLAVNVLAATLARYPFKRSQAGFVVTHVGILIILGGAVVTEERGVEARIALAEGESTDFARGTGSVLTAISKEDESHATIALADDVFGKPEAAVKPEAPALVLGELRVEIEQYLPDAVWTRHVTDDNPHRQQAVEVSVSADGEEAAAWVFADQPPGRGQPRITLRIAGDEDELQRLLGPEKKEDSVGLIRVQLAGSTHEVPVEQCTDEASPLGESGYSIRVLQYLPHAIVDAGGKLVNASDRPMNPAVEVELIGPQGTETHKAFANYPDFRSMHPGGKTDAVKVVFISTETDSAQAPVEVIVGPGGRMFGRFRRPGTDIDTRELVPGRPVETPWPEAQFAVLRRFENARTSWELTPADPTSKMPVPAILAKVSSGKETTEVWVRRHEPQPVQVDSVPYELRYEDERVRFGFDLKLNRFKIGYYPGTNRERSFESHVTVTDHSTGRTQDRVISMNHPLTYGGYTFFQSDRRELAGKMISILSVARDPGQLVVFAGYVITFIGMLWVLMTRMRNLRLVRSAEQAAARPGNVDAGVPSAFGCVR